MRVQAQRPASSQAVRGKVSEQPGFALCNDGCPAIVLGMKYSWLRLKKTNHIQKPNGAILLVKILTLLAQSVVNSKASPPRIYIPDAISELLISRDVPKILNACLLRTNFIFFLFHRCFEPYSRISILYVGNQQWAGEKPPKTIHRLLTDIPT